MDEVEGVVAIGAEEEDGGTREALVLERGDFDLRGEVDVRVGSVGKAFLESVFLEDSLVRLLVEETLLRSDCVGVGEVEVARLQGEWWRTQTNLHDVVEHVDAESGDELIVVVGRGAQLDAGCV